MNYWLMVPLWTLDAVVLLAVAVLVGRMITRERDRLAQIDGFSSASDRRHERRSTRKAERKAARISCTHGDVL